MHGVEEMRSLSRIIKGNLLQIDEPRLIDWGDIITKPEQEQLDDAKLAWSNETQSSKDVEQEAARIWQETEQMIIDLMEKARREANEILNSAREEAELTRTLAQEEAQQLREKGFQEGYQEGVASAHQAMEAEKLKTSQQCQQMLEEARNIKMNMFRTCEADMLRVCLAVAKRIIASEVTTNPNVVSSILQEALSYIDQPDNLTLYVSQKDLETVLELMQTNGLSDNGNKISIDVQVDNRISPGGLRLDSEVGTVDARLETRLANVEKAFQDVLQDE